MINHGLGALVGGGGVYVCMTMSSYLPENHKFSLAHTQIFFAGPASEESLRLIHALLSRHAGH